MKKIFILLLISMLSMGLFAESKNKVSHEELIILSNQQHFGLSFFKEVAKDKANKNVVLSPFATAEALQMIYGGARGVTEKELAKLLYPKDYGNKLNQNNAHNAFRAIKDELRANEMVTLKFFSHAWAANDASLLESYKSLLKNQYQADIKNLNFSDADAASKTINEWVKEKTDNQIESLVEPGLFTPLTKLVLTPVFGFNAVWKHPFKLSNTSSGAFNLQDGSTVDVKYLTSQSIRTNYFENDKAQIVEIPFVNERFVFCVVLPKEGYTLAQVEQGLTVMKLNMLRYMFKKTPFKLLQLPKVKTKLDLSLKSTTQKLGVKSAFIGGQADFSGISEDNELYLTDIVSSNFIEWNESELTAYNATAVIAGTRSMERPNQEGVEMIINRPFLFLVADKKKGTVLEVGHIVNPAE